MLEARYSDYDLEAGVDEAGRGCLAGPVVAAAVILPPDYQHPLINDSKQLKPEQRNALRIEIEEVAISYAVGIVDNIEIDRINILNASFKAMGKAISSLEKSPEFLLIDGNRFPGYPGILHTCIVKGDSKFLSIAAASILAKTYRDDLMTRFADKYPGYGWEHNAGYGTAEHRNAIIERGRTPLHRNTFLRKMEQAGLFD